MIVNNAKKMRKNKILIGRNSIRFCNSYCQLKLIKILIKNYRKDLNIRQLYYIKGEEKIQTVTLKQINENIVGLRKEIEELKEYIHEDFEVADDVKKEIEEAKKTSRSKFIKHEDVVKRFS